MRGSLGSAAVAFDCGSDVQMGQLVSDEAEIDREAFVGSHTVGTSSVVLHKGLEEIHVALVLVQQESLEDRSADYAYLVVGSCRDNFGAGIEVHGAGAAADEDAGLVE